MMIGDYVNKSSGFGGNAADRSGLSGLVVGFSLLESKVIVLTNIGELERWMKKHCEVMF